MTHYDFVLADALDSGDHACVAMLRTRYVYDARPGHTPRLGSPHGTEPVPGWSPRGDRPGTLVEG